MSKQLRGLRAVFGDELFVRTAKGMRPTPRAEEAIGTIDSILADVDSLVHPSEFRPQDLTRQRAGYSDDILLGTGERRHVRMSVPLFLEVGALIAQTDALLTVPSRVASVLGERHNLVVCEVPIEVPRFSYYAFWYQRFDRAPKNRWLRQLVHELVETRNNSQAELFQLRKR